MKFSKVLVSAVLAAATCVLGSDVVQLTGETFNEFISDNAVVMAEFYAPWCGHCQALAPEYEDAATTLKEKGIPITKIDCTVEEALCADQKIQGFPTIKIFHGLDKEMPYQGARKADSIVSYMIRQSLPAVSIVDVKTIEDFTSSESFVVVGFFNDAKSNATFSGLAESLRDKYMFGGSNDVELAAKYGVKGSLPAVVVFKNFDDEPQVVYDSNHKDFKFDEESIKTFVTLESFPVIGEVGPATFQDYATASIPLLYVFVDNDEDRGELTSIMKRLAPKLKGKANIGFLDASQYGGHATNVNLKENWPAVVVQDFNTNLKFVHSQDEEITKESLGEFVDKYIAGELEPSIKSEEIPETQEGPVFKVVGRSYNDIVLDDEKDVLIEFYAPWCGHCKSLAPIYDELASIVSGDESLKSKVVIAKLDHTVNEAPDEIRGYPTIKLYPAGNKDKPVDFTGQRTLEGLAEFIKSAGTHKADLLAVKKEETKTTEATQDKEEESKKSDDIQHEDL
jgi:protein disulfide-isomerase A1